MLVAHAVADIRAAEDELMARLPEGALMQRAAAGLAHAVIDFLGGRGVGVYGSRVLLLVGSGDNGGDALYAGSLLARRGARVEAVLLSDRSHAGGLAALRAAGGRVVDPPPTGAGVDVVIDGIVGIGGSGALRAEAALVLKRLAGIPVVAVDVASGVDADTGHIAGAHVQAELTVTFGCHRIAHLVDPGAAACGEVRLVDIGLTVHRAAVAALEASDVARRIPVPAPDAHKYSRGVVGIRAGSARYPGAGVLCVAGANTGLAGMVRHVGAAAGAVRAAHPEVVGEGRVQAWVVGSGTDTDAADHLQAALADDVPLVIDADALGEVRTPAHGRAVLTPHAGELAAMLGLDRSQIESNPLEHAIAAAIDFEAVVLLKGRRTVIADPDGRVRVNTTGTPWLATAGAGDVLAGLIGSLLAAGLDRFEAASVGAWLHGRAAEIADDGGPVTASGVARAIPAAVARTLRAATARETMQA